MKAFLDVNIFFYAAGREHPYKEPSARLIHRIGQDREHVATDTEVLQEILYRYWKTQMLDAGVQLCSQVMRLVPEVLPVVTRDIELAQRLLLERRNIEPRDAVHAAVMLNHGLTHLYSYDRHFDLIPGLTRLEP